MGKLKSKLIEVEDMIGSVYIFGDFHSAETFRKEVFKEMQKNNVPIIYFDYVEKRIKEILEG